MGWKNILEEVGVDHNIEYFETPKDKRMEILSHLWDLLYKDLYVDSLNDDSLEAVETEYEILTNLYLVLQTYEREEDYELCDVVTNLIKLTEDKIRQIDLDYATNNTKTKR